jgi:cytochrome c-type protein NapC
MADNKITGFLAMIRRPSAKYSLLSLLVVGFFSGIFFWGGFNTGMEATNTLEFCIGCHEMRDNVYVEYKKTIHYTNRTGRARRLFRLPRAEGLDAQDDPQDPGEQGSLGQDHRRHRYPEKFAAHRLQMAESEWARMKANDSRECRNCHSFDAMDVEKQKLRGSKMHKIGIAEKKTCIDCHKGIAHTKPKGMKEDEDE